MRDSKVLRGNGALIYPRNSIPRHVRARSQTCPVQTNLVVSEKLGNL
jgi:hypothetical protein